MFTLSNRMMRVASSCRRSAAAVNRILSPSPLSEAGNRSAPSKFFASCVFGALLVAWCFAAPSHAQVPTELLFNPVNAVAGQNTTCAVTLRQSAAGTPISGRPVTLFANSVVYGPATTNAVGVAVFNITFPAPVSTTITATFAGEVPTLAGSQKTVALTVVCPTVSIMASPESVCASSVGNHASGPPGLSSYSWTVSNGAITSAANIQTITYTAGASGSVGLTLNACNGSPMLSVPITAAPAITTHPATTQVCTGTQAQFFVAVTGSNLSYQWRRNTVDLPDEVGPTLTIVAALADNGANFDCIVSNPCGSNTSGNAILFVDPPLSITVQPQSQTLCAAASFTTLSTTVTGGGSGRVYQWRKNTIDIPNTNSSALAVAVTSTAAAGVYDCLITASCGTITTDPATLVIRTLPTISAQPAPLMVCLGAPASFSVTASGGSDGVAILSYQWKRGGVNINGAVGSTYSIASTILADFASYSCAVTNSCGTTNSSAAALATSQQPSSVVVFGSAVLTPCLSSPLSISVTVNNGTPPFTFQWRKDGVDIPLATANPLTFPTISAVDAGAYSCRVSNMCSTLTSNAVTVSPNQPVGITSHPTDTGVCAGNAFFFITATGSPPISYQWRRNGVHLTNGSKYNGAQGNTLGILGVVAADAGTFDCIVTNPCGPVTSNPAALNLYHAPVIVQQPVPAAPCTGAMVTLSVAIDGDAFPASTFQWRKYSDNIPGATSGTYTIPAMSLADEGLYTVHIFHPCVTFLASEPVMVSLSQSPVLQMHPASISRCPGAAASFSVAASGSNLTYQWRHNTAAIPSASASSYSIASVSPADGGSYDCIVSTPCSSVTSNPAALAVSNPPVISAQSPSTPTLVVCQGGRVALDVTVPGGGVSYQWQKDGVNISGATSPTLMMQPVLASHAGVYRCVVTGACTTTSNPVTLTVCRPDFNCVNGVNVQDIFDFLAAWFAGLPSANFNSMNGVNVQDIFDFLAAWFAGC